jgi:phospholipid/cholesterol/gamma-HCH transport system substrate-binding protein
MASLNRVMDKVEKGQGTIGKLVQEDTVYDNLNNTLAGAQGFVSKVERIKIGVGLRTEQHEALGKAKSYFSLRIKPREDKFYLIEISEDIRKQVATRNTLNSLLYTILFSKRYGNISLKAGLMESSGGVGLDYYLWRDSARFTADLFNFSGYDKNAPNPELKITGRYYLQKYIFLYMGGDELFNSFYQTFFAGFGIMADEDDLKFLMKLL